MIAQYRRGHASIVDLRINETLQTGAVENRTYQVRGKSVVKDHTGSNLFVFAAQKEMGQAIVGTEHTSTR